MLEQALSRTFNDVATAVISYFKNGEIELYRLSF